MQNVQKRRTLSSEIDAAGYMRVTASSLDLLRCHIEMLSFWPIVEDFAPSEVTDRDRLALVLFQAAYEIADAQLRCRVFKPMPPALHEAHQLLAELELIVRQAMANPFDSELIDFVSKMDDERAAAATMQAYSEAFKTGAMANGFVALLCGAQPWAPPELAEAFKAHAMLVRGPIHDLSREVNRFGPIVARLRTEAAAMPPFRPPQDRQPSPQDREMMEELYEAAVLLKAHNEGRGQNLQQLVQKADADANRLASYARPARFLVTEGRFECRKRGRNSVYWLASHPPK